MRPFHSFLRSESVSNSGGKGLFFLTVHEIWMLFISPANPDSSGQATSVGKWYHWLQNKNENRGIILAALRSKHGQNELDF